MDQVWWILIFPLLSFVLIPLIPEKNRSLAGWTAVLCMFLSFLFTVKLGIPIFRGENFQTQHGSLPWIVIPGLRFEFGVLVDSLSILMLLVVTGVGSAIFYYSLEYMEHDDGYRRYFAGLSLFAFSMIGIVLSSNLLQLFIFWELVGLSSYLLIGHWYQKNEAADAGKKAFLMNRFGDFGFLIGILVLWTISGPASGRTLNFLELKAVIPNFAHAAGAHQAWLTAVALLIFMGVCGKSAQFPLHVWLPDAMEGPTPVSALIHAATMVAAGVYLLARLFFLFSLSPLAMEVIAYVGGLTAFLSATQALVQKDIKRILAYSTLSQLGYMVMAVGLGSEASGMYHLTAHAFFKALLFLGAGSIIHASGEQNIFAMGNLIKKMPLTSTTFLIGSYALIGFWPSSGFFTKDQILLLAHARNQTLFAISIATVFLTAAYVGRLIVVAFLGPPKIRKKLHEPTHTMILPLILLAIFSVMGGYLGIERLFEGRSEHEQAASSFVIVLSTGAAVLGLLAAIGYRQLQEGKRKREGRFWVYELLSRKYYVDEFYDAILSYVQQPLAQFLNWFERRVVVDGAVNQSAAFTSRLGSWLRTLQTGQIQTYLSIFGTAVVILIFFFTIGTPH